MIYIIYFVQHYVKYYVQYALTTFSEAQKNYPVAWEDPAPGGILRYFHSLLVRRAVARAGSEYVAAVAACDDSCKINGR